jgi:sirohydrochlorin cobaltochelatase
MSHAILFIGHGSRDPEGVAEFLDMARQFREREPQRPLEVAFLEFARPTIQEAADGLAAAGVTSVVALPGVLMAAGHAKNDMASEIRAVRQRYLSIDVRMARALDVDPLLLQLCRLRYQQALVGRPTVDPADTLLLLVGRGSSDPDANANIAKVARFLQEGYPTGWAGVAYSGVAAPMVPDALRVAERAGFRRIVVQPYFLFTGVLLKRIYAQVDERRLARPDIDYIATPHLQCHPILLNAFAARAEEALHGEGHMNCSLCQYRVPIIGHESHVGEPQRPHHHHVQGLHQHVHGLDDHHDHHSHHGSHDAQGTTTLDPDAPHAWTDDLRQRLKF